MFVNKTVLGVPYRVSAFAQVNTLPRGYNSVVFDNKGGRSNETVVYDNSAIRPVFLLIF